MKQEVSGASGLTAPVAGRARAAGGTPVAGGLSGWLMKCGAAWFSGVRRPGPRLELLERIALAPKQSLALVEVEGRRFLVATSAEGSPAFFALDFASRPSAACSSRAARPVSRVSW